MADDHKLPNGTMVHLPAYVLVAVVAAAGGYFGPKVISPLPKDPSEDAIPVQTSRYVTREAMDRAINQHILSVHPGGVSSREIHTLDSRVDKIDVQIDKLEAAMNARMDRIEGKLDATLLHLSKRADKPPIGGQ